VAEIGLHAPSREVAKGDEGLAMPPPVREDIALDLGIPTGISMLIAEATMDLCGGVPLLGRGVLVVVEDAIDDRLDRAQEGGPPVAGRRRRRFGMVEDMPDGLASVTELPRDLADGHAIASSPPNRAIVVHREHVLGLRVGERSLWERSP